MPARSVTAAAVLAALICAASPRMAAAETCSYEGGSWYDASGAALVDRSVCTSLDMAGQGLASAPTLLGFANVVSVDLSSNNLTAVPALGLSGLVVLNLHSNSIASLPNSAFAAYPNLEFLHLFDNRLAALPGYVFAGLSALRTLTLYDNTLDTLDGYTFAGLVSLRELYLNDNAIQALPAGVFDGLFALRTLHLYDNNLQALLPTAFADLTALQQLMAHGNELATLPTGVFANLTSMTDLHLANNRLSSLPTFSTLAALQLLDVSHNQLQTLPVNAFTGLTTLTTLKLTSNMLTSLPAAVFAPLAAVQRLHLDLNRLADLPTNIVATLGTLEVLALSNNPLKVLPTLPVGLTSLRAAQAELRTVTPASLPASLTTLLLTGNYMPSLPIASIDDLPALTSLDIANNLVWKDGEYNGTVFAAALQAIATSTGATISHDCLPTFSPWSSCDVDNGTVTCTRTITGSAAEAQGGGIPCSAVQGEVVRAARPCTDPSCDTTVTVAASPASLRGQPVFQLACAACDSIEYTVNGGPVAVVAPNAGPFAVAVNGGGPHTLSYRAMATADIDGSAAVPLRGAWASTTWTAPEDDGHDVPLWALLVTAGVGVVAVVAVVVWRHRRSTPGTAPRELADNLAAAQDTVARLQEENRALRRAADDGRGVELARVGRDL